MNQRVAITKKLLKTSLTELLQTQSIYQISIRELCLRAGINRSTFYKYYGSQFDLLSEMEQDLLQNVETTLDSRRDYSENILEQVMEYTLTAEELAEFRKCCSTIRENIKRAEAVWR